jgi:hypothetical protein
MRRSIFTGVCLSFLILGLVIGNIYTNIQRDKELTEICSLIAPDYVEHPSANEAVNETQHLDTSMACMATRHYS